ncbi:hypothetical protein OT109_19380 [Phycisphaeraceae bacterium D3-23]
MTPHFRITLLLIAGLFFLPACGAKKTTDQGAIDAFVAQYEKAYKANDRGAILNQVDWPAVNEELRDFTKGYVYPYLGQVPLESIQAVAYEPSPDDPTEHEGKAIMPSPEPTHRVVLTFEPADAYTDPETLAILIVERDGKVHLCGWSFAD